MSEREDEMNGSEFHAFKQLLILLLGKVEKAGSLEEARELTEEVIRVLEDEQRQQ